MDIRTFSSGLAACVLSGLLAADVASAAAPAELAKHIGAIQAVGPEGKGTAEAAKAFQVLSASDAQAVLPLLQAIEKSGPIARNWLRSAVEVIVEREHKAGKSLPVDGLKAFVLDRKQAPEARRLAFELFSTIDRDGAVKMVPGFINDPSTELRRDAVAELIGRGKPLLKSNKAAATEIYRRALDAARDVDQIKEVSKELKEGLGQSVDLQRHFGFLTNWQIVGPFHNKERGGFTAEFPPEKEVDLSATYQGKDGEVRWQALQSDDAYGKVDINKPFGKLKEVTAFAYHVFEAEEARPAELRLGCKNAWKVWHNGKLLFGRDEYHRGQRIDQYKMPITLQEGKNTILVKLCQNEQKEKWTVEWEFQLRVCDATGTAILAKNRPATPQAEAAN